MGNQNSQQHSTLFLQGSLQGGEQLDSASNYIQMEDHTTGQLMNHTPAQRQSNYKFLACLSKLNCISSMRNRRLPDWSGHLKHQLTHNLRYTQHKWSGELLKDIFSFEQYKQVQEQSIFEVTKASEQSYFDSSEYIARRKDSWRVNRSSTIRSSNNSSFSEDNPSPTSQVNPQDPVNGSDLLQLQQQYTIDREKRLESIIENTELLQESLSEHRNSIYQIQSQKIKSRSSSICSSTSSAASYFDEQGYIQDDNKNMSALLNGMSNAMDDYQKQIIQEEEEYDKMFRSLNRYKEITRVLQRHMQNTQKNPLAFLLQKYVELFGFQYDNMKLSQPSMYLKIITEEVSDFISFMVDLLRVYYRLDYLLMNQTSSSSSSTTISSKTQKEQTDESTQMFFNVDNLQNFVCSILFSFDNFYRKMNKLFSEVDDTFQHQFREAIDRKQNISFSDLGVKTEFHLSEQTLSLQRKSKENTNKFIDQPYSKAIDQIKRSQITKSPLQKLKILLKIYDMIESEIREFYDANGLRQSSSCDADNFLGIIQYIIIKAKAYNIYSDLKMIEHFVKNSSSKSASSYKLITIQGSILACSSS